MAEVFPILAGVVLGLALSGLGGALRLVLLVAVSLACGAVASAISGELASSWIYVVVDSALVALAAGVTVAFVSRRRAVADQSTKGV